MTEQQRDQAETTTGRKPYRTPAAPKMVALVADAANGNGGYIDGPGYSSAP